MSKPIVTKPVLYAIIYNDLKNMAHAHGWNLLLHGSMARDLDLVLIPWAENILIGHEELIQEFCKYLGGTIMEEPEITKHVFGKVFHGRLNYIINLHRIDDNNYDQQTYLDISVIPLNYKSHGQREETDGEIQ